MLVVLSRVSTAGLLLFEVLVPRESNEPKVNGKDRSDDQADNSCDNDRIFVLLINELQAINFEIRSSVDFLSKPGDFLLTCETATIAMAPRMMLMV